MHTLPPGRKQGGRFPPTAADTQRPARPPTPLGHPREGTWECLAPLQGAHRGGEPSLQTPSSAGAAL